VAEVGFLVANLFLRPLVEAAIRGAGAKPVPWRPGDPPPPVLVLDLGALAPEEVARLASAGVQVLAFGPHTQAQAWAALRRAGAVVLPKSRFFETLPQLLASALH